MDFSSFLTSLGTSFVLFLVLMFLFTWLSRRPGNHVVYYPNRILKGLEPYEGVRVTRNPFAWIREAVSSTEAEVIRFSGVDTAVYFVYLTTVVGILVLSGVILLPVLLPIAYTAPTVMKANETTSEGTFNELDKLSMGHVGEKSPRLWVFLAATYWVSFVTYYLLWKAYKHVSNLRAEALMSPEVKNEQFAVLVRDIPSLPQGQTRKEQVDSYFRAIYPDTYYRSMVVTDNKEVNKIYEELEGYRKNLARAEAIYAESKGTASPEGTRPTAKTGFLGLVGKKVDAIEYYDEKIRELIPKLESEQKATLKDKQQSAAVIFFNNRVTAAAASQSLHDTMVDNWTVIDAPEARQLLWTNLSKNFYERLIRQYLIYFIVFLTIFFYMIPIGLISALTTLANLKKLLPFLKPLLDQAIVRTVLGAYLPQLALIIFLALLPSFLLFLSKAEGIPSLSHAQRAASGKYFYFSVLNVFIGVTVAHSLFDTLKEIEKKPNSAVPLLAESLPGSATFFLTFVALKFFVGYGLELSRIVPLIIFHLKKKYLCKTEAEVKEAWSPGDLGYGTRFPNDMLILTIVLCYSVIAPIIILFGLLYFGLGWLVLRNQVLKVYVPSYESYGRMWPHMYNRIMASMVLYQLTMVGYLAAKKFFYTALLIPLPILSFLFVYFCTTKYYRFFQSTALDVACRELKETPNLEGVFRSFIPPSLSSEKGDEDQFEDALSQVSRSGSVV
ncbi:Early-responsive to dehydration stress protein [Perilla frutescens var. hirtella]|uniref:Early-responsive to dehydration stress protein n=1 Tax=Perilla frutescens var. hirtella TaxID=608512 RepID=A0AAD4P3K9_PERFH|nr:Early-responsive to dehydration stress protein [Perilla frutescens var. hirtella]